MMNPPVKLRTALLAVISILVGCTGQNSQSRAKPVAEGIPVRVGTQNAAGLPAELQTDETKPLPVQATLTLNKSMPVELVISDNKPLVVDANLKTDKVLSVQFAPHRAIWIITAAACSIVFFTFLTAVASWRAAVNVKRAAGK